jgi:hypothetical protein
MNQALCLGRWGREFVGIGDDIYGTTFSARWTRANGRFIGRITFDYNEARDYQCLSNGCVAEYIRDVGSGALFMPGTPLGQ